MISKLTLFNNTKLYCNSNVFQVGEADSENFNFIIFHSPTTFDITGYIDIADEYIPSTKVMYQFNVTRPLCLNFEIVTQIGANFFRLCAWRDVI